LLSNLNWIRKELFAKILRNSYYSFGLVDAKTIDKVNILWAADVWHSIKKYRVLELQQLIRAKRNQGK